jgi:hypothetical protein
MGQVISRFNIFKACRDNAKDDTANDKKDTKTAKEETSKSASPDAHMGTLFKSGAGLDVYPADVQLEEDKQSIPQISRFRNADGYFSSEENEHYRKLYANEHFDPPLTASIK